jgi:hypothetical protein
MQRRCYNTNLKECRHKYVKESNYKRALFFLSQSMAYLHFYNYIGIILETGLMQSCNLSEIYKKKKFHHVIWVVLTYNRTLSTPILERYWVWIFHNDTLYTDTLHWWRFHSCVIFCVLAAQISMSHVKVLIITFKVLSENGYD